jgi:vacuolar-type H+-ATPase subunit F/Vma7
MRLRYVGSRRDAIGFALGGCDIVEGIDAGGVARAIDAADAGPDVAIIVISAEAAALNPAAVAAAADRTRPPFVVCLPAAPAEAAISPGCRP